MFVQYLYFYLSYPSSPKTFSALYIYICLCLPQDFLSQVDPHTEQPSPLPQSISDDPQHLYSHISPKPSPNRGGDDTSSESSKSSGSSSSANSPFRSLLLCYRLAEVIRSPCLGTPELMPYGYCVGSVGEVTVWLRGGRQRNSTDGDVSVRDAATVSFASNIPASESN